MGCGYGQRDVARPGNSAAGVQRGNWRVSDQQDSKAPGNATRTRGRGVRVIVSGGTFDGHEINWQV